MSGDSPVRVVEVDGKRFEVRLLKPEPPYAELARRRRELVYTSSVSRLRIGSRSGMAAR